MIDETTLVLYFYGDELSDAETAEIEAALAADPALAARYATLRARLRRAADPAALAAPAGLTARLHTQLDAAADADAAPPATPWRPWALAAALALAVALGTLVVLDRPGPRTATTVAEAPAPRPAFERALTAHLSGSRLTLAGLDGTPDPERADAVAQILRDNRAQIRAAQARGDERLARVLRAFEPVLERLVADAAEPGDAAALREQLEFEMNAMLTKYGRRTSDGSKSF